MTATDHYILTDSGEPEPCPDLLTWARWFETADRNIADTSIGDVRVSTVFLGLNHDFLGDGAPILWETCVFGGPLDGEMFRYYTRQQAHRGHEEMCDRVRQTSRP